MISNKRPTGRSVSIPKGLTIGAMVSLMITLAAVMLMAKLLNDEYMAYSSIGYSIMVIIMTASFLGAFCAVSKIKRRNLLVSILSGVSYFLILLSITALFFGGKYEAVGVTFILVMGSAMLSVFTVSSTNYRRNRRRGGKVKL